MSRSALSSNRPRVFDVSLPTRRCETISNLSCGKFSSILAPSPLERPQLRSNRRLCHDPPPWTSLRGEGPVLLDEPAYLSGFVGILGRSTQEHAVARPPTHATPRAPRRREAPGAFARCPSTSLLTEVGIGI